MNNFSNTKVHWRTCSHYLLKTKIFNSCTLISQKDFSGFGFHICIANTQDSDQDQDSYLLDQDWSRNRKNLSPNTSVMLRIVGSTLFWLAQGDAAVCLKQMAPNVSVAAIHCKPSTVLQ